MFVEKGANPATMYSGNKRLADPQRSLLYQNRSYGAPPLVEVGFDDRSTGFLVGIGLQFKQFGHDEENFQQVVYALSGLSGDFGTGNLSSPLFD